jgi:hypothetical protein
MWKGGRFLEQRKKQVEQEDDANGEWVVLTEKRVRRKVALAIQYRQRRSSPLTMQNNITCEDSTFNMMEQIVPCHEQQTFLPSHGSFSPTEQQWHEQASSPLGQEVLLQSPECSTTKDLLSHSPRESISSMPTMRQLFSRMTQRDDERNDLIQVFSDPNVPTPASVFTIENMGSTEDLCRDGPDEIDLDPIPFAEVFKNHVSNVPRPYGPRKWRQGMQYTSNSKERTINCSIEPRAVMSMRNESSSFVQNHGQQQQYAAWRSSSMRGCALGGEPAKRTVATDVLTANKLLTHELCLSPTPTIHTLDDDCGSSSTIPAIIITPSHCQGNHLQPKWMGYCNDRSYSKQMMDSWNPWLEHD